MSSKPSRKTAPYARGPFATGALGRGAATAKSRRSSPRSAPRTTAARTAGATATRSAGTAARAGSRMATEFVNRSGRSIDHGGYRRFLARLAGFLGPPPGSLTVLFCGDEEIGALNRTWRGKRAPTDVLSFPGSGATAEGRVHIGDVAISVDTAARQARRARRPLVSEIEMLLAHGLLHCLGYDHETDDGTMMKLQAEALRRAHHASRGGR